MFTPSELADLLNALHFKAGTFTDRANSRTMSDTLRDNLLSEAKRLYNLAEKVGTQIETQN